MESPEPLPTIEDGLKRTPRTKSASHKKKLIPTTVPKPFNLGLNKRVEDRKEFKVEFERRQQDAQKRDQARKDEQDEEDRRALKEYRKSLVFKATPIRKYPDVTISPSSKELTCPIAPTLRTASGPTRRRRRSRGSEGDSSMDEGRSSSHNSLPVEEAAPA